MCVHLFAMQICLLNVFISTIMIKLVINTHCLRPIYRLNLKVQLQLLKTHSTAKIGLKHRARKLAFKRHIQKNDRYKPIACVNMT